MEPRRSHRSHPLAKARHRLDLSQPDLARLVGAHPATISAIEAGRRPSPALARRLAAAVGAAVETIFPEEP